MKTTLKEKIDHVLLAEYERKGKIVKEKQVIIDELNNRPSSFLSQIYLTSESCMLMLVFTLIAICISACITASLKHLPLYNNEMSLYDAWIYFSMILFYLVGISVCLALMVRGKLKRQEIKLNELNSELKTLMSELEKIHKDAEYIHKAEDFKCCLKETDVSKYLSKVYIEKDLITELIKIIGNREFEYIMAIKDGTPLNYLEVINVFNQYDNLNNNNT